MYPLYPPPNEKIIVSLDEACVKLGNYLLYLGFILSFL